MSGAHRVPTLARLSSNGGMGQSTSRSWIADDEKYGLLGLSVKVTAPAVSKLDLLPRFQIIGADDFSVPDHWRGWLGTIRVEEVEACDLFVATKLTSAAPEVLDAENIQLNDWVWDFYGGLLLSSTFATAHKTVVLTGCSGGEVGCSVALNPLVDRRSYPVLHKKGTPRLRGHAKRRHMRRRASQDWAFRERFRRRG